MLDVFFTFDIEIWCGGWKDLDAKFSAAFDRYIYGTTSKGSFGLPHKLQLLQEHGLLGVFFVEPLFSTRFGLAPLVEIVDLIQFYKQEIQLHIHTEWVDEAIEPLLDNVTHKKQHLRYFSLADQIKLIDIAAKRLKQAGVSDITAFRAGNFASNQDTLQALMVNNISIDSSYNASCFGLSSGINHGRPLIDVSQCDGIYVYPLTVFHDGFALRHTQVKSCAHIEMEGLLWQALETGRKTFVILSHNFELLNQRMDSPDDIVVKRFRKLCQFLAKNNDCFRMCGFKDLAPVATTSTLLPLTSPVWKTSIRLAEQAFRRGFC